MSTREQDPGGETRQREILHALIEEEVLHRLGEPEGMHKVQVRALWQNHYRVNVFVGESPTSATIANSYFVETDSEGKIIDSNPKIANVAPVP